MGAIGVPSLILLIVLVIIIGIVWSLFRLIYKK